MKKYIAGICGALALSASAHAEQVTYNFSGYFSFMYKYVTGAPWPQTPSSVELADGTLVVGQSFQGQLSYDTATVLGAGQEWGPTYTGAAPLTSATLTINGSPVAFQSGTGAQIDVYDNDPYLNDRLAISTFAGAGRELTFNFISDHDNTLHGAQIPAGLNIFNQTPVIYFGGTTADGNTFTAFGSVTSLERVGAVPEAETWAMLLAGLGLLGWRFTRRHGALTARYAAPAQTCS